MVRQGRTEVTFPFLQLGSAPVCHCRCCKTITCSVISFEKDIRLPPQPQVHHAQHKAISSHTSENVHEIQAYPGYHKDMEAIQIWSLHPLCDGATPNDIQIKPANTAGTCAWADRDVAGRGNRLNTIRLQRPPYNSIVVAFGLRADYYGLAVV